MKKISIYIPLLVLASCATEEVLDLNSPADYDTPKIVVCGGSTAPGTTRADEFPEPSNLGICNADKIRILTFKKAYTGNIEATALELIQTTDIDLDKNLNYRDKYTTYKIGLSLSLTVGNWFALPSIAYDSGDENKFSISSDTYGDLKLNILFPTQAKDSLNIPELYFGRLLPAGNGYSTKFGTHDHTAEDMVYNYSTPEVIDYQQLKGKLYRIVSQLNINISEVSSNVEKIEMYLSNVPITIGLYAKHRTALDTEGKDRGHFYPIVEATGDGQHSNVETLVCTVTNEDYADGTAKLSTFILPSAEGRTVTVKAYFKTPIDENGNKTVSRTLRASQNYYLTEETSKVYFSSEKLLVYDAVSNKFMSYPNVRVNVSGKLSDIFSEESESNVEIEICPNYDGEHNITIN